MKYELWMVSNSTQLFGSDSDDEMRSLLRAIIEGKGEAGIEDCFLGIETGKMQARILGGKRMLRWVAGEDVCIKGEDPFNPECEEEEEDS